MPYIGNPIYQSAFVTDTFSGNGTTTAFTMSVAPAGTTNVLVAVSGVLQDPSTYGVVGTTLNFSAAPPSGTGNISVRYLGIPATGVTTTAYRTVTEFTATAGQTTFTPPSYTVGFIDVYRNGVLLGSADFTATNGTTIVLANPATAGDLVETISFLVSSVLNAIPNTAGSVGTANIADSAITTAKIADNSITTAKIVNEAVTTAKIADSAITTAKIAAGAVATVDIADAAVTAPKIDTPYLMVVGSGYTVPDGVSNIFYDLLVEARGMSHNSNINMVFTVAGRYKITTGWRFGSGGDVWTGVRLANSSGTVIAKGYGTGQFTNDPGPCEISFIANITSAMLNTNMRMQFFRAGSTMGIGNPNSEAGYAIVTTVHYVGI
jgi:hypothetical protein